MKTTKQPTKKTKKDAASPIQTTHVTLKDSLSRIVKYGKKNNFAQNQYRSGDLRCPIAIFFTDEQLDHVVAMETPEGESMNGENILGLAQMLGNDNIHAVTGMTSEQAYMLQYLNDIEGPRVMLAFIDEILAGRRTMIGDVAFDIKTTRSKK